MVAEQHIEGAPSTISAIDKCQRRLKLWFKQQEKHVICDTTVLYICSVNG